MLFVSKKKIDLPEKLVLHLPDDGAPSLSTLSLAWVFASLLLVLTPLLAYLNPIVLVCVGTPALLRWRFESSFLGRAALKYLFQIGLLLIATVAAYLSSGTWLNGELFASILLVVLALKWLEATHYRELRFVLLGALVASAVGSRYLDAALALGYGLLVFCAVVLGLLVLHDNEHQGGLTHSPEVLGLPSKRGMLAELGLRFRTVASLLGGALPCIVVLYLFFPRVQGPLTDLGLVIGLPIKVIVDQSQREQGVPTELKPGQVSRQKKNDAPILVAEFSGAVPYKSRLYWRGPVYSDYDGKQWVYNSASQSRTKLLRSAYKNAAGLDDFLTEKRDRVSYEARVSANGTRYLYGLDVPVGRSAESFVSSEFQLLGIRKLREEFNYGQEAWLEYRGGRALSEEERTRYLQLPPEHIFESVHSDDQIGLRAWASAQRAKAIEDEDFIYAMTLYLASSGYELDEVGHGTSDEQSLALSLLESRRGTLEHLVGALGVVFRAAGIPARVVSGYRGGSLIALTNFVIVREANAHLWLEVWVEGKGWSRFEAKDYVQPPLQEQKRLEQKAAIPSPKAQPKSKPVTNADKVAVKNESSDTSSASTPEDSYPSNEYEWFRKIGSGLETWLFRYSPEQQISLMQQLGAERVDWRILFLVACCAMFVILLGFALLTRIGRDLGKDSTQLAFESLNEALGRKGLACRKYECCSAWLRRLESENLAYQPALARLVEHYQTLRFDPQTSSNPPIIKEFKADVKRFVAML